MTLSVLPISLSITEKDTLDDVVDELKIIEWETGEYFFHNFIDYFPLSQVVKVEKQWDVDLNKEQYLYLHSLYDRHILVAKPIENNISNDIYLFSDWFLGECRVLTSSPKLKQRQWEFEDAFELYRFTLPRVIKISTDITVHLHQKTNSHQWEKVILRKDAELTVIQREKSQGIIKNTKDEVIVNENEDVFMLVDQNSNEFILSPSIPLHFTTKIKEDEFDQTYHNHNQLFTISEIMMRYELPLDIEVTSQIPTAIKNFQTHLRLEKFCVAKSVIAFTFAENQGVNIVELSPLTQFTLHCVKSLTRGLPRDGQYVEQDDQKINDSEYERVRSGLDILFEEYATSYCRMPVVGAPDEIMCVESAYEVSVELKENEPPLTKTYLTEEEALNFKEPEQELPVLKSHPKRFTVHASADPSNPYSNLIEYEEAMETDELVKTQETGGENQKEKDYTMKPTKK